MTAAEDSDWPALIRSAVNSAGLDADDAELIQISENAIYRLRGGIVVRISQQGQFQSALRETRVARWLEASGVAAVQVAPGIDQPIAIDGRAATFWRELPPHRHSATAQVAAVLKQLHQLPLPTDVDLGLIAPFVRLEQRIAAAHILTEADRQWLRERLSELQRRWNELPAGRPWCVIHGDAWVGNIVATEDGRVVLLDLERTSIGPPEWDLVHTAIKWRSFGWITKSQYTEFCDVYGFDVTTWEGYELLRDIRELRMATMAAQVASSKPMHTEQARHRLMCIKGERGPRPWPGWAALG